jgi:phage anti-repressor protein
MAKELAMVERNAKGKEAACVSTGAAATFKSAD